MEKEILATDNESFCLYYDAKKDEIILLLNAPMWNENTTAVVQAWKGISIKDAGKETFEQIRNPYCIEKQIASSG